MNTSNNSISMDAQLPTTEPPNQVAIATPGDETLFYVPTNLRAWIQSDRAVELPMEN